MQKHNTHFLYTLCWDCSHCGSSTTDCIPQLLYSASVYCFPYPCVFYSIFICCRLFLFGGVHHLFYQSVQTSKKGMSCLHNDSRHNHSHHCSSSFHLCFYTDNNTSGGTLQQRWNFVICWITWSSSTTFSYWLLWKRITKTPKCQSQKRRLKNKDSKQE